MAHAQARPVPSDLALSQILSIFEPLDTPFGVADSAGRLISANPSLDSLLQHCGRKAQNLLLKNWIEPECEASQRPFTKTGALRFDSLPFKKTCLLSPNAKNKRNGKGGAKKTGINKVSANSSDPGAHGRIEATVHLEAYRDPQANETVALCTIHPTRQDNRPSGAKSHEPPFPWNPTALGGPSGMELWRRRIEEIGDSFDLARIGSKTCKVLQDLTGAHGVVMYGQDRSTEAEIADDPENAPREIWRRLEQIGEVRYFKTAPDAFPHHQPWIDKVLENSFLEFDALKPDPASDRGDDDPFSPEWLAENAEGAALPCRVHGDTLGLVFVWGPTRAWHSPLTADLLGWISSQAAQAIEHARWFQFARRSDSRSQQLIEDANAIILGVDLMANVTLWNHKAREIFGYTSEEILGRPIFNVFRSDSRENAKARNRFAEAIVSREILSEFELSILDKHGNTHHVVWNTSPFSSPNGATLGLYAIGQDITHRKELESQLATSEKRYRNLVETTHDLYWILRFDKPLSPSADLSGEALAKTEAPSTLDNAVLTFLNRAFIGHDRQYLIGQKIHKLENNFTTDSWRRLEQTVQKVLATEEPVHHLETEHLTPGSSQVDAHLLSDFFPYYEKNRLVGVQILSIDVTDRKEIEAQMLQAQKLESVGTLARGISHDFNNILNGIGGFLYLIEKSIDNPEKILLNCSRIKELASRAARLTRQMQTYARQGKTEKRSLDLNQIVRRTLEIFQSSLSSNKRVELKIDLADNLEWIEADVSQIEQVVMNLCINGAEAMHNNGGTLSINTRPVTLEAPDAAPDAARQVHYSALEVRDTGSGMTPQVKARIFDPFFTTKKTGNGLGLSAVYGILKAHHALTRVDSQIGHGTCFTIHFPASDRKKRLLGDAAGAARVQGGHETILVVDDEAPVRMVSEDILQTLGYRVVLAADGEEAVRIFQERPQAVDLALMDIDMPNLNGRAAAKIMRLVRPDIKILFVSGYSDSLQLESLHEDGFHRFLAKPYTMFQLQNAVRATLDAAPKTEE